MLAGQPNAGKPLFNRLTGLNARTANFAGTTVEVRKGSVQIGGSRSLLLDLPGLYGLSGTSLDQQAARAAILGESPGLPKPDVLIAVLDSTRLQHHLPLVGELRRQNVPVIVALNMIDEAEAKGYQIDVEELSLELGAPVVPISARSGIGVDDLLKHVQSMLGGALKIVDDPPTALLHVVRVEGVR